MVLALLVAVATGTVVASVAGARRTESAMDRFVAFSRPEDVYVQAPDSVTAEKVAALPQVVDHGRSPFVFLTRTPDGADAGSVVTFAAADERIFRTMNRVDVIRGRQARTDDPTEVVVNELAARRLHLGVGSPLTLYAYNLDQVLGSATSGGTPGVPAGPTFTVRVVGVVRAPADVNPGPDVDVSYLGQQVVVLTPAFLRTYATALGAGVHDLQGMEGVRIRLRHGLADLGAFTAAARPLIGDQGQILVGGDTATAAVSTGRAIHFQALALLAFAALAGLAALVIVGQALARQVTLDSAEHPTLRALGMDPASMVLAAILPTAVIATAGVLAGVALAGVASPLFPMGLAGQAEIHPGLSLDPAVLGLGALAAEAAVLVRAGLAARRAARRVTAGPAAVNPPARRWRLATSLASAGLPAPASSGVGMALDPGQGAATIPVRSAMVAGSTAVAGVMVALTFALSLNGLVHDPRRQGWNWDVLVGNPNSQAGAAAEIVPRLADNPLVGAFSGVVPVESIEVAGHQVEAGAVDDVKGDVFPTVVQGRAPRAADEIALAGATLAATGRRIGDTVDVKAGDRSQVLRIVAQVVAPTAGNLATSMSKGAVLTVAGARRLVPDVAPASVFAVRYAPGADRQAAFASLERDFPRLVLGPVTAPEVQNLRRVAGLPYILAALLIVLGGAAMAHALVTTIRRRRRDLAILKTLGFVRRQVNATVAWQASTLAVVAVVVGLPLGLAVGRWSWALVVTQLGTSSGPVTPVVAAALALPLTLAVANLVAAGPGWMAGRVRPATVLRTE